MDSWHTLLRILTKHSVLTNNSHQPLHNEFRLISDNIYSIALDSRQFIVPPDIEDILIYNIDGAYFIVVNSMYVYMISIKVCKFLYAMDWAFFRMVNSFEGNYHFFFREVLADDAIHTMIITVDDTGCIVKESTSKVAV